LKIGPVSGGQVEAATSTSAVPPIRPFSNYSSSIDADCPHAAWNIKKVYTTRRGTRYMETKALEMNQIVIGDAFRIDSS
jgi:hypothetical protein